MARRSTAIVASAGLGGLVAIHASAALAGCPSACPPTPCCSVPTTHQVTVPGITVTPPSISIIPPTISVEGAAAASSSASAAAVAGSSGSSSGVVYAVGGGSGFYIDQGSTGVINALNVEAGAAPAGRVCVAHKTVYRPTAIQAVCLDDKAVPHPASQVTPDRELSDRYEGEVYRCIAGARMQYTFGEWGEHGAVFEHGQTHVCQKGEALYRSSHGELMCRAQAPARDCNERSLLRRYGAGLKVLKAAASEVCTEWRSTGGQTAASAYPILLDGGVGGVVH